MKMKRLISVMCVAGMMVSMITGCGGSSDDGAQKDAVKEAEGTAKEDLPLAKYPETVTVHLGGSMNPNAKIPEGMSYDDNSYTRMLKEDLNIEIVYDWVASQSDYTEKMSLSIGSNTVPELMNVNSTQYRALLKYDMIQPLDQYFDDYASEALKSYVASGGEELMKCITNEEGEIMAIPAPNLTAGGVNEMWIRQDWLDEVGMDMPTNEAELEEVGRAWKEAGLGTLGNSLITQSFTYEYPYFDDSISEEEYGKYLDLTVAPLTWEPSEKYLKNLNEEYNEGIVDQEFYLNAQDTDWKADFVSGRCGTYKFRIGNTTDVFDSLLANNPDAEVSTLDPGALSPEGKGYYYAYPPYGMVMGISATTPAEERAAVWMYLEWLSQPENLFKMQNGVEGDNYTLDEDGIAVPIAGFEGESKLSQNNNKDYWCLVVEDVTYGDAEKDYRANLRLLAPAGYEYLIEQAYNYYQEDAEYGIVTPVFTKVIESISEYSSDLNAMWQEFYVDLATCDPSEFDAKYEEYCQEYLEGGYQDILDEKQEAMEEGSYIIAE